MTDAEPLFEDPEFLRTLAYLDLRAKQILSGARRGERRGARRGGGTLFAEHRSYSPGDDLRYLDWNVYGRLGTLFTKEFEVEESASVLLFLDRSISMDFGRPSKLTFARKVAGALGYIALSHLDRVKVIPVPGGEFRSFAGKRQAGAFFAWLMAQAPEGRADLLSSAKRALAGTARRGVAILVTDLFVSPGYRKTIEFLRSRRQQVFVIQVVSEEEASPVEGGSVRLVDAETGRKRDVKITPTLIEAYRRTFQAYCTRAERFARRRGVGYARFSSGTSFGRAVLDVLSRGGIVR